MEMHACLLFVDMLEEYNVSLFQRLKITEKGDKGDTDDEDTGAGDEDTGDEDSE